VIKNKFLKSVFFRRLAILLAVAAIILCVFFILVDKVLPNIALVQIAELTGTKIMASSVEVSFNGSVFIEELVIGPERQSPYDDAILKADTVYARFGIGSLLALRPRLKEIRVDGFSFDAQQDLDTGQWNLAGLKIKIPGGGAGKMPLVWLKSGVLQYSKVSNGQPKVAMALPIDVELGPAETAQGGYSFTIATAKMGVFGKSTLTGSWKPGVITITGGISSEDIPAFEKVWKIDVMAAEFEYGQSGDCSLAVKIKDFLYTNRPVLESPALVRPKFLEKFGVFGALQRFYDRHRPAGKLDIELKASGNLQDLAESVFKGKIYCKDVSVCDRNFPYPMEHIAGRIDFTERSLLLNNLSGEHNDVKLFFNGWSRGFGENRSYQYEITSDNMALDDDLYIAMNTQQKKSWSAFSPSGRASIKYVFSRDPQTGKKRTLAVELLGAEAVYHRFPYPLKNLAGSIFFDNDSTTMSNLVSQFDKHEITINGKVAERKSDRPVYDVLVEARDIPLDSTLAAALNEGQRKLYNRCCLGGMADAEIRIVTPRDVGPTSFAANVFFRETLLKIDESGQIISDVSGEAIFTPDLMQIKNLRGGYDDGFISLAGRIRPGKRADDQLSYCLEVEAQNVSLSDDLFSRLPEPLEKIVLELQPTGRINYKTSLSEGTEDECPRGVVTVDCLANSINFKQFGRSLKDIVGKITITQEGIELEDITAKIGNDVQIDSNGPAVEINGWVTLEDNTFSHGRFKLGAKDVLLNELFGEMLPENFRTYYTKFSPSGQFDVNSIEIIYTKDSTNDQEQIEFTGGIRFEDCNLNTFPPITQLNGALKISGFYEADKGLDINKASFVADSLRIKGKSLTELKADISYDPNSRRWTTDDLIADSYGGRLTGKFELQQPEGEVFKYQSQIGFDNIDVEKFFSDTESRQISGNGYTQGQLAGALYLAGELGSSYQQIGRCRLKITDMQVGKLSPLAKLLTVLRLTEPKDFAFEQMVVDSYVKQNKILINEFDLSGDSVAFKGTGWMDLQDQNVNLTLTARGRRLALAEPSILQSLTDTLGRAVVRMEVSGNYYDPDVTVTTLPVIKDTLGIFGTEPLEPR
jgi:hypothetical protein